MLAELESARATLDAATAAFQAVDARVRAWASGGGCLGTFLERRSRTLRAEVTAMFAQALDGLHELLVRIADRSSSPAFSSRLRSPATRRLQARIRTQLRVLHRAFDGGGALLARSLSSQE
jgi:hypothetical protein